ncbi:hypothetical protein E2C01_040775 [Portunus trituberculatus]|uniref:Uncharacterized protein n=1 Tax=Portunus trituberculatus TaxID=210409 RepID=A0A5B7FHI4_PORTR|nr:hypothetical protein [Portunus trituberculatus]
MVVLLLQDWRSSVMSATVTSIRTAPPFQQRKPKRFLKNVGIRTTERNTTCVGSLTCTSIWTSAKNTQRRTASTETAAIWKRRRPRTSQAAVTTRAATTLARGSAPAKKTAAIPPQCPPSPPSSCPSLPLSPS